MSYTPFKQMKAELSRRPGVTNPGGLAATLARRKYGNAAVQQAAKTGHSLKGHKPKHNAARDKKIAQFVKGR